jgi:hypothetical protein
MIYVRNSYGEIVHQGDYLSCTTYARNAAALFGEKGLHFVVKKEGKIRAYKPFDQNGE